MTGERSRGALPAVVLGVLAAALPLWLTPNGGNSDDAHLISRAGAALMSGDWAVFAHIPEAQVGPLPLLLAGALPWAVYAVLASGSLGLLLWIASRLGAPDSALWTVGAPLLMVWPMFAWQMHADDVLVILGAALMVLGLRDDRSPMVVAGFALAASGKPTAAVLVGLLLVAGWRVTAAGLGLAAAVWAPFVFADLGGFLDAGRGIQTVQAWSLPWLLGSSEGAGFPAWVRPTQLMLGFGLCWWLARRGQPAFGVLAAFAARTVLEPGTWWSYSAILLALCLLAPRLRSTLASLAAASWLFAHWWGGVNATNGVGRLACLTALLVVGVLASRAEIGDRGPRLAGVARGRRVADLESRPRRLVALDVDVVGRRE